MFAYLAYAFLTNEQKQTNKHTNNENRGLRIDARCNLT